MSKDVELDRIIFIGRNFDEYLHMFGLSPKELQGLRILDCPAGACSFTAHANQQGIDVTACDIAYAHDVDNLRKKGINDIVYSASVLEKTKEKYVWDYFKSVKELSHVRRVALEDCTSDMLRRPERYHFVTLPTLPYKDNEFDLILSAHFLFMYADRLSYEEHVQTVNELIRVAKKEVRIFPLVDLHGQRYLHLDELIDELKQKNLKVREEKVNYEFQKNANSMLVITKN